MWTPILQRKEQLLRATQYVSEEALVDAANALLDGAIVAFPTETVYGLGASVWKQGAILQVFARKGRPADNPLIVHIAQEQHLQQIVEQIPPEAERLMECYWPGPLTIVLPKTSAVFDVVSAGLPSVAVRMPA
ncbi:MAG: Sua5/YciO/YrdC/YwlC family protein [Myxococcota bacterium]